MRKPLCGFRRKPKSPLDNGQEYHNGPESEDELNLSGENHLNETHAHTEFDSNLNVEHEWKAEESESGSSSRSSQQSFENGSNKPENNSFTHENAAEATEDNHGPESHGENGGLESEEQPEFNEESLDNLLDKMNNEQVELDDIKNLSITVDQPSQLAQLQTFVSKKLTEMIKRTSFGEKCISSFGCLGQAGAECRPIDKLLGCFADAGAAAAEGASELLDSSELQVPEAESVRDPPTLPSGIKFVDDFNQLLDKWADESSALGGKGSANVFKLFNLSALLKHLGDPRYVEILNKLKLSGSEKSWEQILTGAAPLEGAKLAPLDLHPLPELPNPKAVSNCTAKLVDLPQLDNRHVDEHAFKLYWAYTNAWLSKMFGPSFRNSRFLLPTRNWYMNMERASQLFFLRLSKTLCSA